MERLDPIDVEEQDAPRLATAAFDLLKPIASARPFLAVWPEAQVSRPIVPTPLPVLQWLDDATSSPATSQLLKMLKKAAGGLAWRQSYTAADFGPAFLDRYGWTEVIGPSGPITSDHIRCGFLLLGPELRYPSHAHAAEELYLPLAGTASWQRGEAEPVRVPPGTPIHHPSWLPHAMRTWDEPLVALYCWQGGALGAKPQIMDRS